MDCRPDRRAILLAVRELGAGGSERQMVEMAKALQGVFAVHVVYFREGFREPELHDAGVTVKQLPLRSLKSLDAWRAAKEFRAYVREHGIELVHSFDYPTACFLAPATRWAKVPVMLTSQRAHRELNPAGYVLLQRLSDRLAHGIVVNCLAMQQHMIHDEKAPAGKVHLCYNGIDAEKFPVRTYAADTEVTIGTICVQRPEKDLATLLRAFAAMQEQHARLVLVGDGPERPGLEEEARKLGLSGRIRFEPQTARVAERLQEFDIFVMPSVSEAFSNSIMEALACGCAVVASDTGGNPELIRDGDTGLLFPPRDVSRLREQLDRLAASPAQREQLGRRGAEFVRHNFSRERAAARLAEIYRRLLLAV